MKTTRALFLAATLLGVAGLSGCSTVDSRIAKNRDAFSSYPPAVQSKIVQGQVDVGFTQEQVRLALGEPDRVFTRTTADGTTEVWGYRDKKPKFSFGVGVDMGGGHSYGGVGVNTSTGGYHDDEKMGVVFDRAGQVSAVETRSR